MIRIGVVAVVRHFIIISNDYLRRLRIALDIVEEDDDYTNRIGEIISDIMKKCDGEAPFSTHSILAFDGEWESVEKSDPYFKNVVVVKDYKEFMDRIMENRKLKGIEVGNYILNKLVCTHLKLEKLCYLCYADYLCGTKKKYGIEKKLFEDDIYAFKLGPVVKTVFDKYRYFGYENIGQNEPEENDIKNIKEERDQFKSPSECRILASENGWEKVHSINETLEKYGKLPVHDLVDIVHRANTPWDLVYKEGENFTKISDEEILEYHCNERP